MWRIGRERVLLAGGPAALLLQIAHPLIAAGVSDHSDFRQNPFARLRATLDATLRISFGDTKQAHASAAAVRATHSGVRGRLGTAVGPFEAGTPYDASDPALALWVHATLVWAALETYHRLVRSLGLGERAAYYDGLKPFAALFGVTEAVLPNTYSDFLDYFRFVLSGRTLVVGPQGRALAAHILRPPLPYGLGPLSGFTVAFTAGLLPGRVREAFGLAWGSKERAAAATIELASRGLVRALPPGIRYWPHYREAERRAGA